MFTFRSLDDLILFLNFLLDATATGRDAKVT